LQKNQKSAFDRLFIYFSTEAVDNFVENSFSAVKYLHYSVILIKVVKI